MLTCTIKRYYKAGLKIKSATNSMLEIKDCNKAYQSTNIIKTTGTMYTQQHFDNEGPNNLYQTSVRPTLLYGCEIWPTSDRDEKRMATTEMRMP